MEPNLPIFPVAGAAVANGFCLAEVVCLASGRQSKFKRTSD